MLCPCRVGTHIAAVRDALVFALIVQLQTRLDDVHRLQAHGLCHAAKAAGKALGERAQGGPLGRSAILVVVRHGGDADALR